MPLEPERMDVDEMRKTLEPFRQFVTTEIRQAVEEAVVAASTAGMKAAYADAAKVEDALEGPYSNAIASAIRTRAKEIG